MAEAGLRKRSLMIAGHATSVALEPAFWKTLEALAAAEGLSLPALVARLDHRRTDGSLASTLRLAALEHALGRAARPG